MVEQHGNENISFLGAAKEIWEFVKYYEDLKRNLLMAEIFHPVATIKFLRANSDKERIKYQTLAYAPPAFPRAAKTVLERIGQEFTLANGISASRPLLVVAANAVGLSSPAEYMGLMAAAAATDALDGRVARSQGESPFGGMADITADRAAEILMYLYLSGQGIVPGWVPTVVIGRGVITDIIRASHLIIDRDLSIRPSALSPTEHPLSSLATSRPLRIGYASLKLAVALTAPFIPSVAQTLSEIAAAVCLIRGVPVVFNRENKRLVSALKSTLQKTDKE